MKYQRVAFFAPALCLLLCTQMGCVIRVVKGSGVEATDERTPAAFSALSNETMLDVELVAGSEQLVRVTCDDNLLQYLKTEVRDGTLVIYQPTVIDEPNTFLELQPSQNCLATVTTDALSRVDNTGSGELRSDAAWPGLKRLSNTGSGGIRLTCGLQQLEEIENTGSGAVYAAGIVGAQLTTRLTGSGDVSLAGEVAVLDLEGTGSGKTLARGLGVQRANVEITGSGGAEIHATDCVDITITGSGNVHVAGNPRICSIDTPGSGEVIFD
ncbi:MAG: head GIN domain-containing protein [Pseudomonadota bacterium]